ncbi:MAG: phage integrase N-terminal SAM-like domain-containing protein, partial [Candidatus Helarchaeota archaeon]
MTSYFSLTQAFNGFVLAYQARRLSHHTIADYSNTLRKLNQYLDNKAVNEIIKYYLRCFLADQRVSNKTLQNYHTGLSSFFKWTKNEEIVDINPLAGIQRPKAEQRVT